MTAEPSYPVTVKDALSNLADTELSQFLRAMDHVIADHRREKAAAAVAWFKVLREAGEADQRWRNGTLKGEMPYWEIKLAQAATALSDDEIAQLSAQYQELFTGESTVPLKHPLAMLAGVCQIVLELESERRHPVVA